MSAGFSKYSDAPGLDGFRESLSLLAGIVKTGCQYFLYSLFQQVKKEIGNSRITDNLAGAKIDWALQVTDQDMVTMVYQLLREEGWLLGSSTALNVCGAVEVARKLGPGHTIVTMLCDGGGKYQSSLFNREWLD